MTDEQRIRDMVRRVVGRALGTAGAPQPKRRSTLVTELDLHDLPEGGEFVVPDRALVTPLARQVAMERKITLVGGGAGLLAQARPVGPTTAGKQRIAIGSDHGGYQLKELLKDHLQTLGYAVLDCGTDSASSVDYPDFALAVAQLVAQGDAWRGIVIDGAGIGSCMAANKVPGVRAAMCYDQATAHNSRAHNDANVLSLGAGLIGAELGRQIVTTWLDTAAGGGRHARRVDKIMEIERRFLKKG